MQRRQLALGAGSALLMALLARPAWAQNGDSGEFTILQAHYGTENKHVDVTRRLRDLARQDRRFQLTNDLFGVDPDPGRQKTLRLYVRDRQGQERYLDYRERDWVEGAQFVGWAGGNWGESNGSRGWQGHDRGPRRDKDRDSGEFTILHATYGTARREVDVTDRLRELARNDVRFRLTNEVFRGIDPDPGRTKRLRIVARNRAGQQRNFDYRENQTVDGSQFIGWGRGDWGRRDEQGPSRPNGSGRLVIDKASYGADGRWVDVTQQVRAQVRGERLEVEVRNELFGVDPTPGRRKTLSVTYRRGNEPARTVQAGESDVMRLP